MKLKCPTCKKVDVEFGAPDFPFCSERCRLFDLGAWAAEKYVISSPANPNPSPESEDE